MQPTKQQSVIIFGKKKEEKHFEIKWKILGRACPFSPVTGKCELCTLEKYIIIFKPELANLNSRNEIHNHCTHKRRVLLDKT